ncbi:hypothetical protein R1flu_026078 [Riccia fluitans]|uniref:Uncharacterized protein n=1 Tax=Riccia fluitans TaxID=41844 RepID=A0ABD1XEY2_9MARC
MVEIGSCSYASTSKSCDYDCESQTNYSAPKEIARTIILIVAVSTTIFMVTDYATMAARFCYRMYSGNDI